MTLKDFLQPSAQLGISQLNTQHIFHPKYSWSPAKAFIKAQLQQNSFNFRMEGTLAGLSCLQLEGAHQL